MCNGGFGGSTVNTSRRCKIGRQISGGNVKGSWGALCWRQLENCLPGNSQSFGRKAIRLTGWRHHHRTHCLNSHVAHCRVIVNHPRHRVWRLTAVALTFHLRVAYTHECAGPCRSRHPGQEDRQKNYRSYGF